MLRAYGLDRVTHRAAGHRSDGLSSGPQDRRAARPLPDFLRRQGRAAQGAGHRACGVQGVRRTPSGGVAGDGVAQPVAAGRAFPGSFSRGEACGLQRGGSARRPRLGGRKWHPARARARPRRHPEHLHAADPARDGRRGVHQPRRGRHQPGGDGMHGLRPADGAVAQHRPHRPDRRRQLLSAGRSAARRARAWHDISKAFRAGAKARSTRPSPSSRRYSRIAPRRSSGASARRRRWPASPGRRPPARWPRS